MFFHRSSHIVVVVILVLVQFVMMCYTFTIHPLSIKYARSNRISYRNAFSQIYMVNSIEKPNIISTSGSGSSNNQKNTFNSDNLIPPESSISTTQAQVVTQVTSSSSSDVIGRPHTDESKLKISQANKGRVPWNIGRKHSEETKRKIAERTKAAMLARKEKAASEMGLSVDEYDMVSHLI